MYTLAGLPEFIPFQKHVYVNGVSYTSDHTKLVYLDYISNFYTDCQGICRLKIFPIICDL